MLDIINFNINRQNKNLKLFEIGNTYYLDHKENVETKLLSISISGEIFNQSWLNKDQIDNFYYIKGLIKIFGTLKQDTIDNISSVHLKC